MSADYAVYTDKPLFVSGFVYLEQNLTNLCWEKLDVFAKVYPKRPTWYRQLA